MHFTVEDETGATVAFECPDTFESRLTCGAILEGRTYPHLPFTSDVRVILDVGANCGATSVDLARRHPDAVVHAFEPGAEARSYLLRNAAEHPNVVVHPFGLHSADGEATLYLHETDLGQASVLPPAGGAAVTETVALRSAAGWLDEAGIDRVDILKVDVEGVEVEVLESLAPVLPEVQVLYVEYDSRSARRRIDALLAPTHELYLAVLMALDQGECLYVRADLADHPDAQPRLREIFTRALTGR